ncbi:class I SAM-dependent methyltransferase [Streptomyces sp. NBC_00878]|uniref:class I SAM-dependent methyltransferase n=1 Tax=Streptomyces sp. NBC_00878 TaxID=2975854 RepID=UPI002258753B|nr:class I SAM-dependent methyltransferase [Streptomyces sp. NBC_00878]MCX4906747.1 class I SAM-dependent methyltransferase [Streptomyces sp. NBC_00878]
MTWAEDRTDETDGSGETGGSDRSTPWHSESAAPPPRRVVVADDRMKADTAYRLACEGTALLWRGDFHNARQLLQAMGRRIDRKPPRPGGTPAESFHLHRRARGHRARVLGRLLVLLEDDHSLTLRRAPDVRRACTDAYGPSRGDRAVSLKELLGVIGAREWREKGVEVPALGARIHPHFGVFSPVRGEYVDLVARAALPTQADRDHGHEGCPTTAFDLGTGTGVLAAVLARRGFDRVVATDINPRALACARENAHRLGLADRIDVTGPGLYPDGHPDGRADLVVCNPPWIPASPTSSVEQGVYDANGTMLHDFLYGLAAHLRPGGEGWLVLSDLAEHLGLRTRAELLADFASAGLRVADRLDTRPRHPRARDTMDPLHRARAAEVTSLWRLVPIPA